MRLLNVQSFLDGTPVLDNGGHDDTYAIFSHCWEGDELLFEDLANGTGKLRRGYSKVERCCKLAAADGYTHVWIDNCCIDKSSSSELSEAINSMFQWYSKAAVCYAYLFDIDAKPVRAEWPVVKKQLRESKWFTRGWTLQELIAPEKLKLYSGSWEFLGDRNDLANTLHDITNIDLDVLRVRPGYERFSLLFSFSISKRMSWAANRQTTRPEDIAYCLLGLFDVTMAMLYGEGGTKAFYRLQEEIMKTSTDETLFAWNPSLEEQELTMSFLADSPSQFATGSHLLPTPQTRAFSMTNKGLYINIDLLDSHSVLKYPALEGSLPEEINPQQSHKIALLNCYHADNPEGQLGIHVVSKPNQKTETDPVFSRTMKSPVTVPIKQLRQRGENAKADLRRQMLNFVAPRMETAVTYNAWNNLPTDESYPFTLLKRVKKLDDVEHHLKRLYEYLTGGSQDIYITHRVDHRPTPLQRDTSFFFSQLSINYMNTKLPKRNFGIHIQSSDSDGNSKLSQIALEQVFSYQKSKEQSFLITETISEAEGEDPQIICEFLFRPSPDLWSNAHVYKIHCGCGANCDSTRSYSKDTAGTKQLKLRLECSNLRVMTTLDTVKESISGRPYTAMLVTIVVFGEPPEASLSTKAPRTKRISIPFLKKG